MKLVGCMLCRNEEWVLGLSARVALLWCDALVIYNHASIDRSLEIATECAKEHSGRVIVFGDPNPVWDEMRHREEMRILAREQGATHVAIIDADEVMSGNLLEPRSRDGVPSVRFYAAQMTCSILQLPGYNLRGSINSYHANGIWGKRWFSTAFADDPRLSWSGDKFHSREPQGIHLMPYQAVSQGQGGVMHLWGASERRLRAKSALYKLTERLRWPNKPIEEIERMYNWAIYGEAGNPSFGTPATWTYADVPTDWWSPYQNLMKYLDVDAEPWQEAEIHRIIKEHGPRMFQELDLFGIA